MKFSVAKCHSMRVTRHLPSNQIHFNYSLHQQTLEPVNTLELLLLTTWNGVNMFLKFLLKQLRLWVFFGAIWLLHLSIRRKLHTKHWFALSSSMQLLFGIPIMKLRRKRWRKCRRQQLGGSAGDGIIKVALMLDWPSLEDRRLKSSLTFFYKIHSGTVSLDKDKYLTPAPRLRSTRASHDSQYTRYMSYSDALKNSFFPRTIPLWNSLPSSVVASKTTEEFNALIQNQRVQRYTF